jgi:hypothetical protein
VITPIGISRNVQDSLLSPGYKFGQVSTYLTIGTQQSKATGITSSGEATSLGQHKRQAFKKEGKGVKSNYMMKVSDKKKT